MTLLPPTTNGLILDMDGVLWTDTSPIGDLPQIFTRIQELNLKVALATNNSTRTVNQYAERLWGFGVTIEPWQIITSSLAVVDMMSHQLPVGSPIFVIGEQGLVDALKKANFELLSIEYASKADAVVMGLDKEINFEKMREATLLVRSGKPFFATNPDLTFPTSRGQIPGAGAWISVIVAASGIQPTYAGKPYPYILELALQRLGTAREFTYVIGDRLETDIAGGQALGCPTGLVLSGVSTRITAEAWLPKVDIIADSLSSIIGIN